MKVKNNDSLDADIEELIEGLSPKEQLQLAAKMERDAAAIRKHIFGVDASQYQVELN